MAGKKLRISLTRGPEYISTKSSLLRIKEMFGNTKWNFLSQKIKNLYQRAQSRSTSPL